MALKEVAVDDRHRPGAGGNTLKTLGGVQLAVGQHRFDAHTGVLHVDGDHVGADGAGGQSIALGGECHRLLFGGGLFHQFLNLGQTGQIVLIQLAVGHYNNLVGTLPLHGQAQIFTDKADGHEGAVVFGPHGDIHSYRLPVDQRGGGVQLQLHRGAIKGTAHAVGLLHPFHGATEGLDHAADGQHGAAALGHQHHGAAGLVDLGHGVADDTPGTVVPHGDHQIRLGGGGGRDQAQHQHQHSQQGQYTSFHRYTSFLLPRREYLYLVYQLHLQSSMSLRHSVMIFYKNTRQSLMLSRVLVILFPCGVWHFF